jgi:hypothetical protein
MVMMVVIVAITTPYCYLCTPQNNKNTEVEEKRKEGWKLRKGNEGKEGGPMIEIMALLCFVFEGAKECPHL